MSRTEETIAPVDLPHLRNLTLSDPVLERQILALFGDRAAAALKAILNANAAEPRHQAAHRLAGAARAIGAWELAEVASTIEAQPTLTAETAEELSRTMSDVVDYVSLRLAG
jgi:HPt (histidine-containing phosphotransfer) domain-containing protein